MLSKIINYVLLFIILFCIIGVGLHYYATKKDDSKAIMCHKNKVLYRIGDEGTVYLRAKELSCVTEKDILIIQIKDTSDERQHKSRSL